MFKQQYDLGNKAEKLPPTSTCMNYATGRKRGFINSG
jgi:hypothetical protein